MDIHAITVTVTLIILLQIVCVHGSIYVHVIFTLT